jgi:uncharacterized membrane protein YdjX (TVP38/TMEM64 family)
MAANAPSNRAVVFAAVVVGAVTLLGFIAPFLPGASLETLRQQMALVAGQWWAPLMGVGLFTVLASVGAPQIVLITALVLVFGGPAGFVYSMTGKLLACALGFGVGRLFGSQLLRRYETPSLSTVVRWLNNNGFWASAVVRLVPTVPSVIVNIAAGATPMSFRAFLAGTALGSVPKMAAIAIGGRAGAEALSGNSVTAWVGVGIAIVLWLAVAVAGRRILRRWRAEDSQPVEPAGGG